MSTETDHNQKPLFDWVAGRPYYHGLPVEQRRLQIADRTFGIATLIDASDLLDEPDFAQRFLEEDLAPHGLQLWPAAIMLTEHILQAEPGAGRNAVELGAGLALGSIAASTRGWRVTITDNDPVPLRFARYNAEKNNASIDAYKVLDWRKPPVGPLFDRVWAADVLYQLADQEPVLKCIDTLLAPRGLALVADPDRKTADSFDELAQDHGFKVALLPASAPDLQGRTVPGRIFVLQR
jgi:predicted nicotinamide N-methyase